MLRSVPMRRGCALPRMTGNNCFTQHRVNPTPHITPAVVRLSTQASSAVKAEDVAGKGVKVEATTEAPPAEKKPFCWQCAGAAVSVGLFVLFACRIAPVPTFFCTSEPDEALECKDGECEPKKGSE
eukprot:GHVN01055422.1.p1 GENE.GHVN01055422.1~~GHVN01055422.1.p1  ORF type:complete len:126 (+),score=10.61 GHVN01055422.1:54-431(+)